jgi:hypothetical protein
VRVVDLAPQARYGGVTSALVSRFSVTSGSEAGNGKHGAKRLHNASVLDASMSSCSYAVQASYAARSGDVRGFNRSLTADAETVLRKSMTHRGRPLRRRACRNAIDDEPSRHARGRRWQGLRASITTAPPVLLLTAAPPRRCPRRRVSAGVRGRAAVDLPAWPATRRHGSWPIDTATCR